MKEVLDIKYKELEESKPILEVLENYVIYKKKLDEILIGYQAYVVDLLILDIPVDPELPLLLGRPFLRTCGAIIDMGRDWGNEGYGTYKEVDGDGDWHARFEIFTPSVRKFNRAFKTKTTTRKLSGKFKTKDVLRTPIISFMRPFGCPVTILNTLDHLGKFDGKADEGFLVRYSINSKAFIVFNSRTRKVEENLHVNFLENKPNVAGGAETNSDAGQAGIREVASCKDGDQSANLRSMDHQVKSGSDVENINRTNSLNTASPTFSTASDYDELDFSTPSLVKLIDLEATGIFEDAYDDRDMGAKADYNNLEKVISVSPIPSTRVNKDHPKEQIIREIHSTVQTRGMTKLSEAGLITFINKQRRTNHKDFQNCLFSCFLSRMEPKKVTQALDDESWVEAMQEELLQFKLLNVWTCGFTYGTEGHWY
ncbi:hypothetical protein Tco_0194152 [Tanacetum coccineum]